MAIKDFSKPIPGMSLTTTPKNAPWERPPEINDPKEALKVHIDRLNDAERMDSALFLLENTQLTLKELVSGIVRGAVANGIHSIDVGLLVAPAIHEFIKQTADTLEIEYDEGLEDKKAKSKEEQNRTILLARKMLKAAGAKTSKASGEMDTTEEAAKEDLMIEDTPEVGMEETPTVEAPKGLMAKRV